MYSVCQRYTSSREQILEVMNLGFAKAMLNLKSYDTDRSIEAWLKSVMINVAIDEFRRSKSYRENVRLEQDEALLQLDAGSNHSNDWTDDLTEAVMLKLDELPEVTRKVFNLHAIDGYKHKEISEMLDLPVGTCHWHYHSAKTALKEYIKKEFGIDPKKAVG